MAPNSNNNTAEIRANTIVRAKVTVDSGSITNTEVIFEPLPYPVPPGDQAAPVNNPNLDQKCEIVEAIFIGGSYKTSDEVVHDGWRYKDTSNNEVTGLAMLRDLRSRLKTGSNPISLGKGGRLLLKFDPPLIQKDILKPILDFDEELGGEEFHIRLGNEVVENNVQPMRVDGVPATFSWGKNIKIKSLNLNAKETSKRFMGKTFEWVMFLDVSTSLSGQPLNQPGLDLKKLSWNCDVGKISLDIAIVIDQSGSMGDNDAGNHYRSFVNDVDWINNPLIAGQEGSNQLRVVAARVVRNCFLNDGQLNRNNLFFWVSFFKGTESKFYYHNKNAPALGLGQADGVSQDTLDEVFSRWGVDRDTDDNMEYGHIDVKKISDITLPGDIQAQTGQYARDTLTTWGEGLDIICGNTKYDWITDSVFYDYTPIKTAIVDNAMVLLAQPGKAKLMIVISDGEGTKPNETITEAQTALDNLLNTNSGTIIGNPDWEGVIELIGYKIFPDSERIPFFNFSPKKWLVSSHEVNSEAELKDLMIKLRNKYDLN